MTQGEILWDHAQAGRVCQPPCYDAALKNIAIYTEHTGRLQQHQRSRTRFRQGAVEDSLTGLRPRRPTRKRGSCLPTPLDDARSRPRKRATAVDVFNTASWPRTDLVTLTADDEAGGRYRGAMTRAKSCLATVGPRRTRVHRRRHPARDFPSNRAAAPPRTARSDGKRLPPSGSAALSTKPLSRYPSPTRPSPSILNGPAVRRHRQPARGRRGPRIRGRPRQPRLERLRLSPRRGTSRTSGTQRRRENHRARTSPWRRCSWNPTRRAATSCVARSARGRAWHVSRSRTPRQDRPSRRSRAFTSASPSTYPTPPLHINIPWRSSPKGPA